MEQLQHIKYEPQDRRFQCDWESCNKNFNRKSDLERHYRIHTNERPYTCTILGCDKTFIQRSALTVHIRTHTGEKPHKCPHVRCGKRFSDSSSLARHRRIHTGSRPYKCDYNGCSKTFCRRTTMFKHQRQFHQHDIRHCNNLDDSTPELDVSTPKPGPDMSWTVQGPINYPHLTHDYPMHRIASSVNGSYHMNPYIIPKRMDNPHGLPAEICQYGAQEAVKLASISEPHPVHSTIDQNNLRITTIHTKSPLAYCVPQQEAEQPAIEIPYSTVSLWQTEASQPKNEWGCYYQPPVETSTAGQNIVPDPGVYGTYFGHWQ